MPRPANHPVVNMENLEQRQLLSVSLSNGVLTVTGTSGDDFLEVQLRADTSEVRVNDNGSETEYPLSSVRRIVIDALAGNDDAGYSGRDNGLDIPGLITGGDGNDTLEGGLSHDNISGGPGRDRIQGRTGRDTLTGGSGADFLEGGSGNDILFGNGGNDDLSGNRGDDFLNGGSADDDLQGGDGSDRIKGRSGNDDFDNSDALFELKDSNPEDDGPNSNV